MALLATTANYRKDWKKSVRVHLNHLHRITESPHSPSPSYKLHNKLHPQKYHLSSFSHLGYCKYFGISQSWGTFQPRWITQLLVKAWEVHSPWFFLIDIFGKPWKSLLWEVVDAPSMSVFKKYSNLIKILVSPDLLGQLNNMTIVAPFQPNCSIYSIL